tara:strand:- start:2525 stop:2743 length:219 start_codon:yes stop_codon:yes gene_type:complete
MTLEDIYESLRYEYKTTHVQTKILGPKITGLKLKQFKEHLNKCEFDEDLLAVFSQDTVSLTELASCIFKRRA